jgi:POT family proton-dependent oligopeptide transporter
MATFYAGLTLIVVGTGLLKPNISAIVGDLYPEGGARRDAGFSIYYMGINVGAFLGPLVCGYLGESVNWHLGFSAAGVGMVLGLVQYAMGGRWLGEAGHLSPQARVPGARRQATRTLWRGTGVVAVLTALLAALLWTGALSLTLVEFVDAAGYVIVLLTILFLGYVAFFADLTVAERKRVGVIGVCFVAAALFWSGFEQAGSSMNLFAERLTDRDYFGWEMPASWLQSVNALCIVLLAPVFSAIWLWLGARNPSIPAKFALGLVQLGAGFLVMAWASVHAAGGGLVSPAWLVATYFLHTTGELCLSPVGLSSMTKLSPPRFVGQMMGIWFVAAALGNLIAGRVAGLTDTLALPQLFGAVALFTAGAGVLLLLVSRPVARMAEAA